MELLILILFFGTIVYFVHTGIELFSKGWTSYEERMSAGKGLATIEGKVNFSTEKTLDAMFLTLPPQLLTYLSLASFFMVTLMVSLLLSNWSLGLFLGILALALPLVSLKVLKKRRDALFGIQLVSGLNNMGNALKAGLSLPQAIDLVATEMDNPIAQEFRLLSNELKLGTPLDEGLAHLEDRMPNPDLTLAVTAINISTEVGGNLSEVFENISGTIRERQVLAAKVKALTAQGKMQGTVMCMLPVGLVGILSSLFPDMMRPLFHTTAGMVVIVISIVMLTLGWLFMVKITQVDY